MATPYISEIRILSFGFPPKGWALCNGQLMAINQNQALFSLLGTMYGGNGQTNFALPNLQGRVPIHAGNGHTQGQAGGEPTHTLNISEMPAHTHAATETSVNATTDTPNNSVVLGNAAVNLYRTPTTLTAMEPGIIGNVGDSQPHPNMQPYLTLNFSIALQGIFPPRN